MFKKSKLKKQKKQKKIINYITYIWLIILFLLSIFIFNKISNWEFNIYKTVLINNESKLSIKQKIELARLKAEKNEEERLKKIREYEEKIKKELDKKKENILIIWRWGYWNDAPELTDSLILLSYYKEKQQISMISIPRDLYVEYWDENKNWKKIEWKINWLYVHYLEKFQDTEKAVKQIEEKIEEITWEEIDYYINLDFNWFIKLINSIDWITVDVKKNLYDEQYPDNNHWFQIFSLSKWIQKLYGQSALKYARSRKNTGWDFWRSERQQQILKALKEKILSSEYLTSPSKIKNLYDIFQKYITTDIWLIDFTKLATSIKLQDNLTFYSSTLNATCIRKDECDKWWFLYYPQRKFFGWQSVLLAEWTDHNILSDYDKIIEYSKIVFNSPNLFKEDFKISIFSKKEDLENALDLKYELKKYWLKINVLEKIGNIPENNPNPLSGANNIKVPNKGFRVIKNNITLDEYNKLKNKNINLENYIKNKNKQKFSNWIEQEADNIKTKIIINWVDINSNTIKFLKKYLNLENKDILVNIDWPKYARDKNTDIEILYKN